MGCPRLKRPRNCLFRAANETAGSSHCLFNGNVDSAEPLKKWRQRLRLTPCYFPPDGVLGIEQCRPQRLREEACFSARRRSATMPGLLKQKKKHRAVTCLISRREMRIHRKNQSATKPKGSTGNVEKQEERSHSAPPPKKCQV